MRGRVGPTGRGTRNTRPRDESKEADRERQKIRHHTHFELLILILPNVLDQGLRKLNDIRKNDLPLELGMPGTTRKDESYQTDASLDAWQGLVFLEARGSECRKETTSICKLTKSIGSVTVIQPCAHSFITFLESVAVFNAIDKPAHLAPGSFECIRELVRIVHFWTCPGERKSSSVRLLRTKGKLMTADASVVRCSWSQVFNRWLSISEKVSLASIGLTVPGRDVLRIKLDFLPRSRSIAPR